MYIFNFFPGEQSSLQTVSCENPSWFLERIFFLCSYKDLWSVLQWRGNMHSEILQSWKELAYMRESPLKGKMEKQSAFSTQGGDSISHLWILTTLAGFSLFTALVLLSLFSIYTMALRFHGDTITWIANIKYSCH